MTKDELFEKWLKSLDIPLMAWQKEALRFICTQPHGELYISMPRNYGRFIVLKLVEVYKEMIEGEKEMVCRENAEKDCKSYPKCDGCGAHVTEINAIGKNLTKVIDYPGLKKGTAIYEQDDKNWPKHSVTIGPFNSYEYMTGPIVDRLHEFEKLGYEPEQLAGMIDSYKIYERTLTRRKDGVDALYYLYKLAGDIENSLCDNINSMYPSCMLTKDGFNLQYATSVDFRKSVRERIEGTLRKAKKPSLKDIDIELHKKHGTYSAIDFRDLVNEKIVEIMEEPAITRPVNYQKVWVTTSSSVKDDEFIKKLKEAVKSLSGDKEPIIKTFYAPEKWELHHPLIWKHSDRAIGKVTNIESNKEGITMTITKNPEYQFKIKRVLFNNPATIVFWADGDKTVVKCQNGEPYDPEKGLAMAISKKALGNDRAYYNVFAKYCKNQPSEVANKKDLKTAEEDNKTNRALAYDAIDYLKKAYENPKATKVNLAYAMEKAIECMNAILDNY